MVVDIKPSDFESQDPLPWLSLFGGLKSVAPKINTVFFGLNYTVRLIYRKG
jgi:hypothetical protein